MSAGFHCGTVLIIWGIFAGVVNLSIIKIILVFGFTKRYFIKAN